MGKGAVKKIRGRSGSDSAPPARYEVPADVIIPAVDPPPGRVGRYTNQLKFMRFTVLDTLGKMPEAAGFKFPVDPVKFQILNYYEFVKRPMDFGTIRKRIINKYYHSAKECMRDLQQVFANAYVYNRPPSEVIRNANLVELTVMRKLMEMPVDEVEIESLSSKDPAPRGETFPESTPPSSPTEAASSYVLRPTSSGSSTPGASSAGSSASSSSFSSSSSDSDESEGEEVRGNGISSKTVEVWKRTQLEHLSQQMALIQQQIAYVGSINTVDSSGKKARKKYRKRELPSGGQSPTGSIPSGGQSPTRSIPSGGQSPTRSLPDQEISSVGPPPPPKKKPKVDSIVRKPAEPTHVVKNVDSAISAGASAVVAPKSKAVAPSLAVSKKSPTPSLAVSKKAPTPSLAVPKKAPITMPDKTKPMTPEEISKLKDDINLLLSEDFDDVVMGMTHYTDEFDEEEDLPVEKCPVHYQWELYELVAEKLRNTVRYEKSPQSNMLALSPVGSLTLSISPSLSPTSTGTPTAAAEPPSENISNDLGSATTQPVDGEDDDDDDDDDDGEGDGEDDDDDNGEGDDDYDSSLDFY